MSGTWGLTWFAITVLLIMIYVIGGWVYREHKRRCNDSLDAALDRHDIRRSAEHLRIKVETYTALLEQFPSLRGPHLELVRDLNEEEATHGGRRSLVSEEARRSRKPDPVETARPGQAVARPQRGRTHRHVRQEIRR